MDFVDSAFGTEHKGHDATVKGQEQTATGVANMEGNFPAGSAHAYPTQTSTAAPAQAVDFKQPLAYRGPETGHASQY